LLVLSRRKSSQPPLITLSTLGQAAEEEQAGPTPQFPDRHLCDADGNPVPFHKAQELVYDSERRTIAMLAGTQSGKTSFGPWWLKREIDRRGSGDYFAVTSTYDLFKLKMLPEFLRVFEEKLQLGRFWLGDQIFELKDPRTGKYWAKRSTDRMYARVILRSANAQSGLESATVKAMWLDECGQDEFTIDAWRALVRRGTLSKARRLLTTTLYNLGWLKSEVIDPAMAGGSTEIVEERGGEIERTVNEKADIELVQYDSIVNPIFPLEEYELARATMPDDEFQMFYRGRVARLRSLIYDCFDRKKHTCDRFPIPLKWKRFMGLDFGGVNTAAIFYAEEPKTKQLYAYREYHEGGKTSKEHAKDLLAGEPGRPYACGGLKGEGEGQWRREYAAGGLPVHAPDIFDVETGIRRVYAQHKLCNIIYFNDLVGILEEKGRYRRKRDKQGNITDEIEAKATFHYLDAERYIIGKIRGGGKAGVDFV
jgi:hypothetical protein